MARRRAFKFIGCDDLLSGEVFHKWRLLIQGKSLLPFNSLSEFILHCETKTSSRFQTESSSTQKGSHRLCWLWFRRQFVSSWHGRCLLSIGGESRGVTSRAASEVSVSVERQCQWCDHKRTDRLCHWSEVVVGSIDGDTTLRCWTFEKSVEKWTVVSGLSNDW